MTAARRILAAAALLLATAACAPIGPHYVRPAVSDMPAGWKTEPGWHPARPADAAPKKAWWKALADGELDRLEAAALAANPSLRAALLARLDQARALARAHGAALYPTVQLDTAVSRARISADRPLANYDTPNSSTVQNDIKPSLAVSYEVDWLGRVRRDVESARAGAEQSAADGENVRLLLTAQVASAYFELRQLDEEIGFVADTVAVQQRVLELIRVRHDLGAAAESDVAEQRALLESNRAQLDLLRNQRKQTENLLATLTGTPAADFVLGTGAPAARVPEIPVGLPAGIFCNAGPTSLRRSARWPPPTPRSASPGRRILRR